MTTKSENREQAREIFPIYDFNEKAADDLVEELRRRNFLAGSYISRFEISLGNKWKEYLEAKLSDAALVLILLGSSGWGRHLRDEVNAAIALGKPIVAVLVDHPPEEDMNDADGLFRRYNWINLRDGPGGFEQLSDILQTALDGDAGDAQGEVPRFDNVINTLVDGSDADRGALLARVINQEIVDRDGLAARLRLSIRNDFAPAQESRFATAIRDPKIFAAVRSWMLSVLIWLEPLSFASVDLILQHIQPSHEPERNVRFWTLAGIVQRNLPYLRQALDIAREDDAAEVSGLASIVAEPENIVLQNEFRKALHSPEFETVWNVLRVLRIFPVPALTKDVVDQLDRSADGRTLTYDALFALATPVMAHAALPILRERPGIRRLAELVLREALKSTSVARTAFARLLSVFEPESMRGALQAVGGTEDAATVRQLLAYIRQRESGVELYIAGYTPDTIDIAKDDIGIAQDVETLALVMLAREVPPPLAIGLFGEWGSGKSFFMYSIAAAATRIAGRAKSQSSSQFCADIVQIHFNAWHYVDASLWASLVSHLLEGLCDHLLPETDAALVHASLSSELASVQAEMAAAEVERDVAAAQLAASSQKLQETILARERQELRLRDLRACDLLAVLQDEPALKSEVEDALHEVGAPAALASIAELNHVVDESYSAGGRAVAFVASIFKRGNMPVVIGGLLLLFVAPPLVAWTTEFFITPHAATLSALATQVTVVAGALSLVLRQALTYAKAGLDALSAAKSKIDAQLVGKRATPSPAEQQIEAELAAAKASENEAAERLGIASMRARQIEDRVAEIRQNQTLGYFVTERSHSEDYRRHLGLISVVRKDFDGLVQRLQSGQADGARRLDRIILYIDDVDRCPPDIVVDILQAVHLLLAYELFVVVVSVDPRWLLRSLETKFSHLRPDEMAGGEGSGATPHDYLEKIFQIPFSVRPVNDVAFGRMMRRLLAPSAPEPSGETSGGTNIGPRGKSSGTSPNPPGTNSASYEELRTTVDAPPELEELARSIAISGAEAAFAESLHALLTTPRSAKRFANVYRLLKAALPRHTLVSFEGTVVVPGDFQVPMLLLAVLIGNSEMAAMLFPQFLNNARLGIAEWWQKPADALTEDKGEEVRLRRQIAAIANDELFPHQAALVDEWLPRVARFSFLTARMFLDSR